MEVKPKIQIYLYVHVCTKTTEEAFNTNNLFKLLMGNINKLMSVKHSQYEIKKNQSSIHVVVSL